MSKEIKNRRFIAGATCPDCNRQDTIFVFEADGQKWRACAICEFKESIAELEKNAQELPTRVNQHRLGEKPLAHETPVEAVKLVDPDN